MIEVKGVGLFRSVTFPCDPFTVLMPGQRAGHSQD